MDILSTLGSQVLTNGNWGNLGNLGRGRHYGQPAQGSFAGQLGAAVSMAGQVTASTCTAPKIVYMKTDDMLYSGGNGTGLSFYLKYAEDSTEENPIIVAKGIDEGGKAFEQRISVKDINPNYATIVEMRALEAYTGVEKHNGFSSLPYMDGRMGLSDRHDFISGFERNIQDFTLLKCAGSADYFRYSMQAYLDFMKKERMGL